jgi:hypothetical protein
MLEPILDRGGRLDGQTGDEVLPAHVYRIEEKGRCGLFLSLVLFSLVPPSSARSGGPISGTECVAPQSFVTGGSRSYPDVCAVTGGLWYPGYKTPTKINRQ